MADFNYIYKQYYNYIRAIVSRIIKDDANDITQMAFFKLSQCTYANEEHIAKEFLKTTAVRMAIDYLKARQRKSKIIKELPPDYEASDEQQTRDAELEEFKQAAIKYIFNKIAELPEATRKVFELYYFKSMKAKQISKELGITPNTVWSHLSHARDTLRMEILFKKDAM